MLNRQPEDFRYEIKKVKSLVSTHTIRDGETLKVEFQDKDGNVYILDKLNWIRQLKPNQYTIVEVKRIDG